MDLFYERQAGVPNLIIGTYGESDLIGEEFAHLEGKWESYSIKSIGNDLIIAGSSPRGGIQ